jgi:transposase
MGTKAKVSQIGLDVHRTFSIAAARDASSGRVVWRERLDHVDRDELRRRLSSWPPGTPVVLEGTFGWGWMSDELAAAKLDPHLASGRKVAAWRAARGVAAKSNRVDADLLGELWDQQRPSRWWEVWLAPAAVRDQRELLRHRTGLVRAQTAVKNRVHALLHRHGIVNPYSDLFGVAGRRFLSLLASSSSSSSDQQDRRLRETARRVLRDQLILLDALRRSIARATRQFRQTVNRSEAARRLTSLPGVSTVLAYTIVAEVGRIERFAGARRLLSYSLLAPRAHDSGEERPAADGKPIGRRIGHVGRTTLQWAWIQAAHGAVRKDAALRALFDRRTDNGTKDRGRGYIAVANRMCRIAYAMWTNGQDYQEVPPARPGTNNNNNNNNSNSNSNSNNSNSNSNSNSNNNNSNSNNSNNSNSNSNSSSSSSSSDEVNSDSPRPGDGPALPPYGRRVRRVTGPRQVAL